MTASTTPAKKSGVRRKIFTITLAAALLGTGLPFLGSSAASAAQSTASDSFTRTASSGWGKASSGGAYSSWNSAGVKMKVASGKAHVTGLGAKKSAVATLKGVSASDVRATGDITFSKLPNKGANAYAALEVRRQSNGASYRGRLIVGAGGTTKVGISQVNKGKEKDLGNYALPFEVKAGQAVRVEIQATGTSTVKLAIRAYLVGKSAPAWQLVKSDTSSTRIAKAGNFGFWSYASAKNSSAINIAVDNLKIRASSSLGSIATKPNDPVKSQAPAASVPTTARGSVAIGAAKYAVPSNALYVAPKSSGIQKGTKTAPFTSLQKAIDTAKAGQTIVLRAGNYHQSAKVPYGKDSLTIQNFPGEKVWMDGAKTVSIWKASGKTWKSANWKHSFSNTVMGVSNNSRFVGPKSSMAAHPDMLFIDGKPQKQVASASKVVPGTFAANYSTDELILGTNPTGKHVTASALGQALSITGKNSKVQGFGIRGYATAYDGQRAALKLENVGATVQNMHIVNNAMIGLSIQNNDSMVDNVTATNNGMLGINVNAAYKSSVTDTVASNNNTELFKAEPVAGGIKITRSRGIKVDNVQVNKNAGMGLWLDESVYDFSVTNVQANNNSDAGIEVELSAKGIVANNEALNNKVGILIFDSGNIKIYNNDIGGNSLMGIQLSQDQRRQANKSFAGQDPRRPVPDSTVPWLTKDIVIANNVFDKSGSFQVYALDKATKIPVDKMNVKIQGNLFVARPTSATATMVAWGGADNKSLSRYETPTALMNAKGSTWKNHQAATAKTLAFMGADRAKAASITIPLPSDVASVMGSKTGAKVVGKH